MRETLFFTPHQLSSGANALTRTGLPAEEFIQHITDKNYYADSAQLGQEIDLELFAHKAKIGKDTVLYISRGKHRINTVIPDEDKLAILKFTSKIAPIPEDKEGREVCLDKVSNSEEFDF